MGERKAQRVRKEEVRMVQREAEERRHRKEEEGKKALRELAAQSERSRRKEIRKKIED